MTTTYKLNKELNGIEITFSECPPLKVRNLLKENGFIWHKQKKLWYAVDFFQVVALAGKSSVRVRAVNPPMIDEKAISGMSADRTYKITNEILPAIDSIFIKDNEKGDLKRLKDYNDTIPYFTVGASKELATLCTGDTLTTYESWYY